MLRINVNNKFPFDVEFETDGIKINGEPVDLELRSSDQKLFLLTTGDKTYEAELIATEGGGKEFVITLNGVRYSVVVSDRYDLLLERLGIDQQSAQKTVSIKAPMPGLVLSVNTAVGSKVREGDTLIVLEAMKMENSLKAPGEATVSSIHVAVGDAVEKGESLVSFE